MECSRSHSCYGIEQMLSIQSNMLWLDVFYENFVFDQHCQCFFSFSFYILLKILCSVITYTISTTHESSFIWSHATVRKIKIVKTNANTKMRQWKPSTTTTTDEWISSISNQIDELENSRSMMPVVVWHAFIVGNSSESHAIFLDRHVIQMPRPDEESNPPPEDGRL